jgi:transcriptional regulator with XRE-family HTH domain
VSEPGRRSRRPNHSQLTAELRTRLRRQIQDSGLTQWQVEKTAGFSKGYLSQLLNGRVELKMRHVFAVLEVIEADPAQLFAETLGERRYLAGALHVRAEERPSGGKPALNGELAQLFAFGLEAVDDLSRRLARFEQAIAALQARGLLAEEIRPRDRPGSSQPPRSAPGTPESADLPGKG